MPDLHAASQFRKTKESQIQRGAEWDWSLKTSRKRGKGERINPNDVRGGIRRKKRGKRVIVNNS